MVNHLLGWLRDPIRAGMRSIGMTRPARMGTAGYQQENAMSCQKTIGSRPHIKPDAQTPIWLIFTFTRLNAKQSITDVDRASIGMYVTQASVEIGIR